MSRLDPENSMRHRTSRRIGIRMASRQSFRGHQHGLYFAWPEVRHFGVATFARTWANWLTCPPSGGGQLRLISGRVSV